MIARVFWVCGVVIANGNSYGLCRANEQEDIKPGT